MVKDPDLSDSEPRWSPQQDIDWGQIGRDVSLAVMAAQRSLTDVFATEVYVELDLPRLGQRRYIVEEWLRYDHPEFHPPSGGVINGRHRTWNTRLAGLEAVPVINSDVDDAVAGWDKDAPEHMIAHQSTVEAWKRNRTWWAEDKDAKHWRRLNTVHLALFDRAVERWTLRLLGPPPRP